MTDQFVGTFFNVFCVTNLLFSSISEEMSVNTWVTSPLLTCIAAGLTVLRVAGMGTVDAGAQSG